MKRLKRIGIFSVLVTIAVLTLSMQAFAQQRIKAKPIPMPSQFKSVVVEPAKFVKIQIEQYEYTKVNYNLVNLSSSKYNNSDNFSVAIQGNDRHSIYLYPGTNLLTIETYQRQSNGSYKLYAKDTYKYVVKYRSVTVVPVEPLIKPADKEKLVLKDGQKYISLKFKVAPGTYAKVQVRDAYDGRRDQYGGGLEDLNTVHPGHNDAVTLYGGKSNVIIDTYHKATGKHVRKIYYGYNVTRESDTPPPKPPVDYRAGNTVKINGGKTYTYSRNVTVNLIFMDYYKKVRISENRSFSDAKWVDAKKSMSYSIKSKGPGKKVIYVQFLSGTNSKSAIYGDSINLLE